MAHFSMSLLSKLREFRGAMTLLGSQKEFQRMGFCLTLCIFNIDGLQVTHDWSISTFVRLELSRDHILISFVAIQIDALITECLHKSNSYCAEYYFSFWKVCFKKYSKFFLCFFSFQENNWKINKTSYSKMTDRIPIFSR